ncbi:restriction endonuclease subunit S [Citrobacter freundii]|uniref:restriction endonuclease subunit S n=1 Tax=Citrobacter freundii TaxID=546 RepID=UPI0015F45AA6|nr:restriction endonuclease subunit S [Citrobacter freundii]
MGSKWVHAKLGDYIHSNLGKMLDQNKNKGDFQPYLGNSNVRWGYFDLEDLSLMKFEEHESDRYGIRKGDLIICEGGEPGRCAIWEDDVPNMKIQKALHRVRPLPGLTSEYLYYWFLYFGRTGQLDAYFTGTTIKHLTGKALSELPIKIPTVDEQKYISIVLGSLDAKIKANRKINRTLEQMSQTLFKSWFVDFDPVIDNALDAGNPIPEALQSRAELRQKVRNSADFKPLPADIRALFPADLEETEMGWVPKGWKNGNLSDITKILSGFAFKSKDFGDDGKSVIKIKNITIAKTIDIDDTQKISEIIAKDANRFLLLDGDILMAMTGATVGKFGVLATKNNEEYYLNQRVAKFETEKKAYLYCVLNQESTDRFITNAAQGSAQPNISAKDILSTPLLIPSVELINTFNDFISHLFYRMIANTKANLTLTALRDTLLPKLISGELSLEDLPDLADQTEPA